MFAVKSLSEFTKYAAQKKPEFGVGDMVFAEFAF